MYMRLLIKILWLISAKKRAATSKAGGDRLMLGRTDDFLSEKVKEHGIARFGKRKEPVIGLITGS